MRRTIQIFFAIAALAFAGCHSDRNNNNNQDSLLTDTSVVDTTRIQGVPADTTAMGKDSVKK